MVTVTWIEKSAIRRRRRERYRIPRIILTFLYGWYPANENSMDCHWLAFFHLRHSFLLHSESHRFTTCTSIICMCYIKWNRMNDNQQHMCFSIIGIKISVFLSIIYYVNTVHIQLGSPLDVVSICLVLRKPSIEKQLTLQEAICSGTS